VTVRVCIVQVASEYSVSKLLRGPLYLGLEKKLELDELARARSSSARFGSTLRTSPSRACFCGS
jgi:hypothetical protein